MPCSSLLTDTKSAKNKEDLENCRQPLRSDEHSDTNYDDNSVLMSREEVTMAATRMPIWRWFGPFVGCQVNLGLA